MTILRHLTTVALWMPLRLDLTWCLWIAQSLKPVCYGQVSQNTSRFRSSNPVAFDSNSNSNLDSLLELTTAKYRILTAEFSATDQTHSTKAAACIEYTYYSCNEQPVIMYSTRYTMNKHR